MSSRNTASARSTDREQLLEDAAWSSAASPDSQEKSAGFPESLAQGSELSLYLCFSAAPTPGTVLRLDGRGATVLDVCMRKRPHWTELLAIFRTSAGEYPVRAPLHLVDPEEPVELLLRSTGKRLDLILSGVVVHQFGVIAGEYEPITHTALQGNPPDLYAALWDYCLEDEAVETLLRHANPEMIERNRQAAWERARAVAAAAPHRPIYHIAPEANWINDPNGMIAAHNGFHVFFQHNPYGPYWGTMHWGHVRSQDLVRWHHCPPALAPEWDQPDRDGCFSGCCAEVDGRILAFYTAVYPETQCVAIPCNDLMKWKKDPANPLVAEPPYGEETTGFRDPWLWKEADGSWSMIVGSGRASGGALPLYNGASPTQMAYQGDLYAAKEPGNGKVYECPGFHEFPSSHLLIYSPEGTGNVYAVLGSYSNKRFEAEREILLDYGPNFYAPQAQRDAQGRLVLLGWVPPAAHQDLLDEEHWAGCLSIPRVLEPFGEGRIRQRPLPELEQLRGRHLPSPEAASFGLSRSHEVLLCLRRGSAHRTILELLKSGDGEEATALLLDWGEGTLRLLRDRSSRDSRADSSPSKPLPVPFQTAEEVRLHVFVDRSVIEAFVDEEATLCGCVYPTDTGPCGLAIRSEGGNHELLSFDCWEVEGCWE